MNHPPTNKNSYTPVTYSGEGAATRSSELERQIMDSTVPKNEREWWAAREIERLRERADEHEAAMQKAFNSGFQADRPSFRCCAQRTADPPQDCDWPTCGCDDYASKVIAALQESVSMTEDRPMKRVFDAVMETLLAGAPELSDPTRRGMARSIAMKIVPSSEWR
jgi:flagellar biosynthesis/type III secretory pathway protein FliH